MKNQTNDGQNAKGRTVKKARGFLADRRGAAAIEFAMLALPFVMLVMSVIETSISFTAQQVLANATDNLARQLRTGQLRPADATAAVVRSRICAELSVIVDSTCPDLYIDLQSYPTFAAAAAVRTKFTGDNDLDTTGFTVAPGGAETKNMLRVYYKWPVILDLMRKYLSNMKDGKTLLMSMTTWQNEPYD
ncbi:MAG: pilus assembly protein [Phyllobacteriaceae bacterium]|nr:pilus assembly protein [Phyllobacteriaceae bacterium]